MDFIKYRFIYYPVIFIAVIFLLDKIFLIPEMRQNFIQPGGMMYYSQRILQLSYLKNFLEKDNQGKKVAVVMGDSRSFALGNIAAWFSGKKDWYLYNFAGPQAVPAYHFYLAQKIFSRQKRPEYLIIGLSPDGFNKNNPFFANPVMAMGMDDRFIQKYSDVILPKDREAYFNSRQFALMGMQFSFKVFLKRSAGTLGVDTVDKNEGIPIHMFPFVTDFIDKSYIGKKSRKNEFIRSFLNAPADNYDQYSLARSPQVKLLEMGDGANYSWFGTMGQTALKEETEKLVGLYLKYYEVSESQLYFFRETLKLARKSNTRVIVFWPRANPFLIDVYKKDKRIYELWSEIERITEQEGGTSIDLNKHPDTQCSSFYDASHLSIICYPAIAKTILNKLEKQGKLQEKIHK